MNYALLESFYRGACWKGLEQEDKQSVEWTVIKKEHSLSNIYRQMHFTLEMLHINCECVFTETCGHRLAIIMYCENMSWVILLFVHVHCGTLIKWILLLGTTQIRIFLSTRIILF